MKIQLFVIHCYITVYEIHGLLITENTQASGLFIAEKDTRFLSNVVNEIQVKFGILECAMYCFDKHRNNWNSCHGVNFYQSNSTATCELSAYYPSPGIKTTVNSWTFWKLQKVWEIHADCASRYTAGYTQSGVYGIYLTNNTTSPVWVYCDQDTDGGGWTVFQNRFDGSVDFYRDWVDYKTGFGDPYGEYWIGNDVLHLLTAQVDQELRIDLSSFYDGTAYAVYSTFSVADETVDYLLSVSDPSGTAADSFTSHNGKKFSTFDDDNDTNNSGNCAMRNLGGWWYGYCHVSNLNGNYTVFPSDSPSTMNWKDWPEINGGNVRQALKRSQMKVRPTRFGQ